MKKAKQIIKELEAVNGVELQNIYKPSKGKLGIFYYYYSITGYLNGKVFYLYLMKDKITRKAYNEIYFTTKCKDEIKSILLGIEPDLKIKTGYEESKILYK